MARAVTGRAAPTRVGATWARGFGVTLTHGTPADAETEPGLARALADGIERGYAGDPPTFPETCEWYRVRRVRREGREGRTVGMLVLRRDCPGPGTVAVLAIAIDPDERGSATATKALLAMEQQLTREHVDRWVARVPRTNGRGLFFMLRAGLTPIPPRDAGDATWFARRTYRESV